PSGLTVETIRDPRFTKIIDSKPEFSWVVPKGAGIQKAYQILVSSEEDKIKNNIGDVWNSGIVRSSRSFNIEFGGGTLKENTSYYWKVRIFDADNRLSEYSAAQQFQTGEFGEKLTSHNWFQVERIKPVHFKKNDDGSYFADFGKDAFGTLEMIYTAKKAENLTIRLGEKLLDGKIDHNPGGTIRYSEVKLQIEPGKTKYQLQLVPDQRNTGPAAVALPDSFPVVTPFRYAEIECSSDLKPENLTQIAYFNCFDNNTSVFASSDTILNAVW
ncbi:MAG TPA: hypothetical protein VLQ91_10200, partial [Draconibacterium sp.]|nr:hypothetical protein [Draconibacterium sp.]